MPFKRSQTISLLLGVMVVNQTNHEFYFDRIYRMNKITELKSMAARGR